MSIGASPPQGSVTASFYEQSALSPPGPGEASSGPSEQVAPFLPLDWALGYAAQGWHVFPVGPDKRPHSMLGPKGGFHHATVDADRIRRWWTADPNALIGCANGASGIAVIDADVYKEAGAESYEQIRSELTPTLQARTARGGVHHFYRCPEGLKRRVGLLPGIDLLADGGYTILPPSTTPDGAYTWTAEIEPVELPSYFVGPATAPAAKTTVDNVHIRSAPEGDDTVGEGGRNSYLTRRAGSMRGLGMDADDLAEALLAENLAKCDPPLPEGEVLAIARSIGARYSAAEDVDDYLADVVVTHDANVVAVRDPKRNDVMADSTIRVSLLVKGKNDEPRPCGYNVDLILRRSLDYSGYLRFNELTRAIEVTDGLLANEHVGDIATALKNQLESKWGVFTSGAVVGEQLLRVARQRGSYDPVREYLGSLVWDGVARTDTWLVRYCAVADSEYVRKIGARWLISGAARGLDPGCKVDSVLVLQGNQGVKKSMTFDVLGGPFFTDSPVDLGNKDTRITAAATWIVELAELAALGPGGLERHKAFLSARRDLVRPPYGRVDEWFRRHCVFGATTNQEQSLIDPTGNRRWWVARVLDEIDIDALRRDRDQLWAESVVRYRAGERWWFDAKEQVVADAVASEHTRENPWADKLYQWWQQQPKSVTPISDGAPEGAFKLADAAERALSIDIRDLPRHSMKVAEALRSAGFESRLFGPRRTAWWYRG